MPLLPFFENKYSLVPPIFVVIGSDASGIEAVLIVPVLEQRNVRVIDAAGKFCGIVQSIIQLNENSLLNALYVSDVILADF